ncbi:MAG: glycosyltransferase [Gammaproteobacteria bacterium]|nr:glycosyltransferase [Gammaproteobacteria bacterium]
MNILIISDVYFPRINGVSTSIQTFKTEFEKAGHKVTLIAPEYTGNDHQDDSLIRIASRSIPYDPEDRMMKSGEIRRLIPKLDAYNFDIVHIQTPFVAHYSGIRIAKALRIPCVITYHTLFEEYLYHYIPVVPKSILKYFARRFSSSQCNQAHGVIAPSSIIVELLKDYGVNNNIKIIPTGIKSKKFEYGDGNKFKTSFNIPNNKPTLLNVSRVAFEKNIGLLLEVLKKVKQHFPEIMLIIAGEGPAKNAYMQQAKSLGLEDNTVFVGYLDRDSELIDCYHSADIFVFSSTTETQGLVLLESMAAGTPVISVAAMGTKDILVDCPGAIITTGEIDDFCGKIVSLLENKQAYEKINLAAVNYAKQWDSRTLADKMLRFYQEVISLKI